MKQALVGFALLSLVVGCGGGPATRAQLTQATHADRETFEVAVRAFEQGDLAYAAEAFEALSRTSLRPRALEYLRRIHATRPDVVPEAPPPEPPPDETTPAQPDTTRVGHRIGVLLPLSGRSAPLGNALRATVERLTGGEDDPARSLARSLLDASTPEAAARHVAGLAEQQAFGAVGLFDRASAEAAAQAAEAHGLPLLMITLSDAPLAGGGPTRRVIHSPTLVARTAAGAVLARGGRSAVVLRPEGRYGAALGELFTRAFRGGGGAVNRSVVYDARTARFERVAADAARALREGEADTLFIPGDALAAAQILSHLAAQGVFPRGAAPRYAGEKKVREVWVVGAPEWYAPTLLEQAARYARDVLIPVPFAVETARGARLADRLGVERPNAYDALLVDALAALDRAAERARAEGLDAAAALAETKVEDGATPGLDLSQRDALRALFVMTVRDGRFVPAR